MSEYIPHVLGLVVFAGVIYYAYTKVYKKNEQK